MGGGADPDIARAMGAESESTTGGSVLAIVSDAMEPCWRVSCRGVSTGPLSMGPVSTGSVSTAAFSVSSSA
jgi:hypothetical protein